MLYKTATREKKIKIHKIFISIKNGMEMTKKDKRDSNCTKVIILATLYLQIFPVRQSQSIEKLNIGCSQVVLMK